MSDYTPPALDDIRDSWACEHARAEVPQEKLREEFDRVIAEVERAAAEKAWKRLANIVYPLYEAAEAVLLAGADTQKLMGPLAKLGAQSNPYRLNDGEKQ
ncbi:hypothetical protein QBL02_13125 [Leucobacter sp. UT-8R-CII-1-4]|uniref:hypothetical protein n=1 Tax=Leucobacter sp. UT-8R-CII-1-4 TaxID=3040075 RepID=UPI0024A95F65|nr:hypothetical protein [Leucobacter sp. UT-8R-CII-1-4]MDI6024483.1 hypothetical protein [Leucobacter sp. UT-8R-CII-1-4]